MTNCCRQEKPKKVEIARQDVIVTPDGPIEIFRKDERGAEVRMSNEDARRLVKEYTMKQVPYRNSVRPLSKSYRPRNRSHRSGTVRTYIPHCKTEYRSSSCCRGSCDSSLHRNHMLVKGDSYRRGKNIIDYRNPFDWYNTKRVDLIDDIEEVLDDGFPRGHYSLHDDFYSEHTYAPHHSRSRSPKHSFGRCNCDCRYESRSESSELNEEEDGDVVYIVKKKGPELKKSFSSQFGKKEEEKHSKRNKKEKVTFKNSSDTETTESDDVRNKSKTKKTVLEVLDDIKELKETTGEMKEEIQFLKKFEKYLASLN